MGTAELDPAALRKLGKAQFERLCHGVLLGFELNQRHTWPWGEPDGPTGEVGETDGGRDFSLEILHAPRRPLAEFEFRYAITADEPGLTWYSCKNTKHEDNARKLVLRDVKPSIKKLRKSWSGDGEPPQELEKLCAADGTLPLDLLEVLSNGGRYFILLATQVGRKNELERSVVTELERWCDAFLGIDVDLSARIRVFDANDLARFINHHRVSLPQELELALGIESPKGLTPWQEWFDRFDADRGLPTFETDEDRQEKIEHICAQASLEPTASGPSGPRYAWIAGPPGMGKTRLVLEAIARVPGHERRVVFTEDPEAAQDALRSSWFQSKDDAVVVVDECSDNDASSLIEAFRGKNGVRHNTLVIIGPSPEPDHKPPRPPSELAPLPAAAIRALIRTVAETVPLDDATLEHLADLVGGYPHYAVLLARGLAPEDSDTLAPMSRWNVAQRALAGRPPTGKGQEEWRRTIEHRAAALLAVAIAPQLRWDDSSRDTEDAFGRALHTEFRTLRDAAKTCEERGLLRHVKAQGHQYISPKILGGIILDRFLGGPGPGGSDLGPRIKRELPEHYGDLCMSVQRYGASQDVQRRLAELDLHEPDAHTWERLGMLAQWYPESTARSLRRLFSSQAPEEVVGSDLRGTVVFALTHLCRRRISFEHFELAEEALFRLALAATQQTEDHPWHGRGIGLREVVRVWTSLFSLANSTYQPLGARLSILERRAQDPDPIVRRTVVTAMEAALDPYSGAHVYPQRDLIDGEWPRLDASELVEAQGRLARDLVALADDADEAVKDDARRALARTLRLLLVVVSARDLGDLAERVQRWTPTQKCRLQEALDDFQRLQRHEHEGVAPTLASTSHDEALGSLRAGLSVDDLVARMIMRVGRWQPDLVDDEDDDDVSADQAREGDQALAKELLEQPVRWDSALGWLEQPEALRSADFLRALGLVDERDGLLAPLMARLPGRSQSRNLAMYMRGRHERLDDEATNTWIAIALSRPILHEVAARLLAILPGSDERLEAVVTLAESGALDDEAREILGTGPWTTTMFLSPEGLRTAAKRLSAGAGNSELLLVVGDALVRIDDRPLESALVEAFVDALRSYGKTSTRWSILRKWETVARHLFALGHVQLVIEALLDVLASDEAHSTRPVLDLLEELLEHTSPEQFWQALHPRLRHRRLRSRFYYGRRDRQGIHPLLLIPEAAALAAARSDPSVAQALGELSRPYQERLEPLALRLISELGASGPAARAIAAHAGSTPWAVHSLGQFHLQQAGHARAWSKTADLEVRRWGEALAERLEARAADELAGEAFDRKLG